LYNIDNNRHEKSDSDDNIQSTKDEDAKNTFKRNNNNNLRYKNLCLKEKAQFTKRCKEYKKRRESIEKNHVCKKLIYLIYIINYNFIEKRGATHPEKQ
jgi:hypothetical protein